jgi:hypothetical protein
MRLSYELHKNVFLVARNAGCECALKTVRARKSLHKDDLFDIDQLLPIGPSFNEYYVQLEKVDAPHSFPFSCTYKKLAQKSEQISSPLMGRGVSCARAGCATLA